MTDENYERDAALAEAFEDAEGELLDLLETVDEDGRIPLAVRLLGTWAHTLARMRADLHPDTTVDAVDPMTGAYLVESLGYDPVVEATGAEPPPPNVVPERDDEPRTDGGRTLVTNPERCPRCDDGTLLRAGRCPSCGYEAGS